MARRAGVLSDVHGLGLHDHLCWRYDLADDFLVPARAFFQDGLERGLRVRYVAAGDPAALVEDLRGVAGLDEAMRRGAAQVVSLDDMYGTGDVIDPAAQIAAYSAATEEALAAGYRGLRVVAETTPLVRTPEQLEVFARYEHRIDHYMAARPFSAMCAYQVGELSHEVVAQLACMHPVVNRGASPFRLHAAASNDHAAALGGELDLATVELLPLALHRADPSPYDGDLVLDATGLEFIDHRSMLQLVGYALARDSRLVLRTARPGPARIVDALGLSDVRVELVA